MPSTHEMKSVRASVDANKREAAPRALRIRCTNVEHVNGSDESSIGRPSLSSVICDTLE